MHLQVYSSTHCPDSYGSPTVYSVYLCFISCFCPGYFVLGYDEWLLEGSTSFSLWSRVKCRIRLYCLISYRSFILLNTIITFTQLVFYCNKSLKSHWNKQHLPFFFFLIDPVSQPLVSLLSHNTIERLEHWNTASLCSAQRTQKQHFSWLNFWHSAN